MGYHPAHYADNYYGVSGFMSPIEVIEERLDHAQDHMFGLLQELTGNEPIDCNAVNFYLEEICSVLKIKEIGNIKIQRGE